ncbi:unnamed protein product [Caenorhabditis brenneri]
MSELPGTSNPKTDNYSALIDSTLKTSGKVEVVAIGFYKKWGTLELGGKINFEPTRRNITTLGPRDVSDPFHVIYANETADGFRYPEEDYGMKLEVPGDSVEECLNLTRQLYKVLPKTPFRYLFNLWEIRGEELKNLVTKCIVGNYEKISFHGRFQPTNALSHDETEFLINTVKPDTYFELNSNVPDDFKHEKAFQFKSFFYHYAKWVTLDDLKSLRKHDLVRLKRTKLSNKDFNKFLKYWTDGDEPMLNTLTAHIVENPFYNEDRLRNGEVINWDEMRKNYDQWIESECDPEIILANLKYFTSIPRWTGGNIGVIHYIKSKTPGKCAELRIYEKRIELNTEMSTFSHKNIEQMMTITDELEDLLTEKSEILEEEQEQKTEERRQAIETKIEELRKKMKEFGFS